MKPFAVGLTREEIEKEIKSILEQLKGPTGTINPNTATAVVEQRGWRAQILTTYLSYESQRSTEKTTKWLAIATTVLAGATVVLALVTFLR